MHEQPYDKIALDAGRRVLNWLPVQTVDWEIPEFTSPIEKLFFVALHARLNGFRDEVFRLVPGGPSADLAGRLPDNVMAIYFQCRLIDWPIDFVLQAGCCGQTRWLAVECDGHAFHERTKEQAARDRRRDRQLQDQGLTIYRFTGSELWNDPVGCIDQIVVWAEAPWLQEAA